MARAVLKDNVKGASTARAAPDVMRSSKETAAYIAEQVWSEIHWVRCSWLAAALCAWEVMYWLSEGPRTWCSSEQSCCILWGQVWLMSSLANMLQGQ
eukprot:scaffold79651_cov16-Tisochrysis_lutea.AAC.2